MYGGGSQIYLSLDFSGVGTPKILTFSALLDQKPGIFFDKKRLRPLFVNFLIFNQQALSSAGILPAWVYLITAERVGNMLRNALQT